MVACRLEAGLLCPWRSSQSHAAKPNSNVTCTFSLSRTTTITTTAEQRIHTAV